MELNKRKTNNIIDFIIITIFIILNASSASFIGKSFLIMCILFLVIVFVLRKRRIDKSLLILLGIWLLINCISIMINTIDYFNIPTFIRMTMQIIITYLIIKNVGRSFFDKFFRYAYILVLIAFPFFIVESVFPSFISSIAPYLNFMTPREQTIKGGFYFFIYMHSGWAEHMGYFVRNSGFMWEPGAYAFVLTFMITYQLHINNYIFEKRSLVLCLAMLSTFSTAGYFSLFCILPIFL